MASGLPVVALRAGALEDVVDHVEKQTIQQSIIGSKNKSTYNLFKSDLLTMSNTIMVKTTHHKVFFTPFPRPETRFTIDSCIWLLSWYSSTKTSSNLSLYIAPASEFRHSSAKCSKSL